MDSAGGTSFVNHTAFDPAEADEFFEALLTMRGWEQKYVGGVPQPRKTAFFARDPELLRRYNYGGVSVTAQAFPPLVKRLVHRVCEVMGLPPQQGAGRSQHELVCVRRRSHRVARGQ